MAESKDLRQQILLQAESLFVRRGYHGLAMRQIAESVGVSKAALYYHFRDKEELFLAILDGYLDQLEELITRVLHEGKTCRQRIHLLVELILSQPEEQRAVIRLANQEMNQLGVKTKAAFNQSYHSKFIDPVRQILAEGIQSGELRRMNPDIAVWALLGMMYPYLYPAASHQMPDPNEAIEQMVAIYLDGISK